MKWLMVASLMAFALVFTTVATGQPAEDAPGYFQWDYYQEHKLYRVILLLDYNTRVVMAGTVLLGIAAGLIGTFMLLRGRALIGDALAHATLPGIVTAFIIAVLLGFDGKSLPILLAGAALTGLLGVLLIVFLRHSTRIKEDSAMGIILSVFFGLGIVLLSIAQRLEHGHAAGLESFIYGKTASMLASDAMIIGATALIASIISILLYKEFRLLCFDQNYAKSQGWPVMLLDVLLMVMVTLVTVIGLQAVGLVLVIALLVIPTAAARFWTNRLSRMLIAAVIIGAISCYVGTFASAVTPELPSGAIIVLAASAAFGFSMIFGTARGLLRRYRDHYLLQKNTARQNVLRAIYEVIENSVGDSGLPDKINPVSFDDLLHKRSWSPSQLYRELRQCRREGLVVEIDHRLWKPTAIGLTQARKVARQHRLWELYLITHADIAPNHVDRSADMIEHVIGEELTARLEHMLDKQKNIPTDPHGKPTPGSKADLGE